MPEPQVQKLQTGQFKALNFARRARLAALLAAASVCVPATQTFAQSSEPRGGGLFAATRSDAADRDRLNLNISLSEAFDSELPPELQSQVPQRGPQSGGYSTMANVLAEYAHIRRRGEIRGNAETAFRYYGGLRTVDPVGHSVGLGGTLNLPARGALQATQTAAYSPSYLFQLFPSVTPPAPGDTIPINQDYRANLTESLSYGTDMSLGFGSSQGTRFGVSGDYGATDFKQSTRRDLSGYAARANLSHGVGRSGRLTVEYEYRTDEFGVGGLTSQHSLPVGMEYSPALSVSRRAVFRFKVIPSALDIPASATDTSVTGQVLNLQGEAWVSYPFLRTWQALGYYRRGLEYVAVLGEPLFADTARLEVSGLICRRLDALASAGYADGESALRNSNQLDTYTGNVRLRFAWTRSIAAYGEYVYYRYDLRGRGFVTPDLPSVFAQHGLRVGLMLWVSPF